MGQCCSVAAQPREQDDQQQPQSKQQSSRQQNSNSNEATTVATTALASSTNSKEDATLPPTAAAAPNNVAAAPNNDKKATSAKPNDGTSVAASLAPAVVAPTSHHSTAPASVRASPSSRTSIYQNHRHASISSAMSILQQQNNNNNRNAEPAYEEVECLLSIPFFEELKASQLKSVGAIFHRSTYKKGEYILREGNRQVAEQTAAQHTAAAAAAAAASQTGVVDAVPLNPSNSASAPPPGQSAFHLIINGEVEISACDPEATDGIDLVFVPLYTATRSDWYAQTALVGDTLQPVSVQCISDTATILYVLESDYESVVQRFPQLSVNLRLLSGLENDDPQQQQGSSSSASGKQHKQPLSLQLKKVPFFSHASELKLQQLAMLCSVLKYRPGAVVCEAGAPADGFYYIVSGRIEVTASAAINAGDNSPPPPTAAQVKASQQSGGVQSQREQLVHLDTLSDGQFFGELSLQLDDAASSRDEASAHHSAVVATTRRTATCVVIGDSPCILLYLSRARFASFVKLAPADFRSTFFERIIQQRTANSLKAIPLFAPLRRKQKANAVQQYDEERLSLLGQLFKFVQCDAGQVIVSEGSEGDALYLIVQGTCDVSALNESNKSVHLASMGVSQYFGESSLLSALPQSNNFQNTTNINKSHNNTAASSPRHAAISNRCNATVTARTDCILLRLAASHFARFCTIAPDVETSLRARVHSRTSDRLRRMPFFSAVKENRAWSKLDLLGGLFTFEEYHAGDVVFAQGETALHASQQKFYVIVSGTVEMQVSGVRAPQSPLKDSATVTGQGHQQDTASLTSSVDHQHQTAANSPQLNAAHRSLNGSMSSAIALAPSPEIIFRDTLVAGTHSGWFNELALFPVLHSSAHTITPHTATCVCTSDNVTLLSLSHDKFAAFLQIAPELSAPLERLLQTRTSALLRTMSPFSSIVESKPWSKIDLLTSMLRYETLEAGATLYSEGDAVERFYLLMHGSLQFFSPTTGKSKTKHAQSYFGCSELLLGTRRNCTVKCADSSSACLLLYLTAPLFQQSLILCPEWRKLFTRQIERKRARLARTGGQLASTHSIDDALSSGSDQEHEPDHDAEVDANDVLLAMPPAPNATAAPSDPAEAKRALEAARQSLAQQQPLPLNLAAQGQQQATGIQQTMSQQSNEWSPQFHGRAAELDDK